MSVYISALKMSVISIILLSNTAFFGMEISVAKKNKDIKSLSSEEKGRLYLKKNYKNPVPLQVKKRLLSKHVPVIILDTTPLVTSSKFAIYVLNPYDPSFYSNPTEQLFNSEILEIGKKKSNEAWHLVEQTRKQQMLAKGLCLGTTLQAKVRYVSDPLIIASIIGKQEDVARELSNHIEKHNVTKEKLSNHLDWVILLVACYAYIHKATLPFLLSEQKKIQQYLNYVIEHREIKAYSLLRYTAKHKKEFEIIVASDPYGILNHPWKLCYESDYGTYLDRMSNDPNFDHAHIVIARKYGAKTYQELLNKRQQMDGSDDAGSGD